MNRKIIGRMLGFLLLLECVFLFPSVVVCLLHGEVGALRAILTTMIVAATLGCGLCLLCRKADRHFYAREGFLITALGWTVLSLVGALPFWFSGEIPSYVDAVFEVISGFTTTGASILPEVESMSKGLLFWRSFTHWLGGMGILVFLLAVVPMGKGGGDSVHILRAESPGPNVGKLVPKLRQTAAILYGIYVVLTVLNVIFLLLGGMSLFDSLCTAFGTAGTGGFGVRNDSMASYSPYLQTVCTVFMALFGINFTVYFLLLIGKVKQVLKSEEVWVYLCLMLGSICIIALNIAFQHPSFRDAFHHAAFTVSSIMTTTGFATVDFDLWPQLSRSILMVLMICGACAGSTGGGIKTARLILLVKSMRSRLRQFLRPRSVNLVRFEGRTISDETIQGVTTYMTAYCAILVASFLVLAADGFSLETNLTAVLACLNNIGPGLGLVGPTGNYAMFSAGAKIVLMLDMLLGRLEIFPLLIMLSPSTWRRAG